MRTLFGRTIIVALAIAALIVACWYFLRPTPPVDFSTQVKPIINTKCISCHGGVKAKAGFSLLFREDAMAKTESGKPAIIPGDASSSEMIKRIKNKDPEERMPYKHAPLSDQEIHILEAWINQGAKWGNHWAYLPVKETAVPEMREGKNFNDIDKFILDKLIQEKMQQSPLASRDVMLRRVSLDLIGTLPSADIANTYLKDGNYEKLVDNLLASPRFGEKWASMWLDIARYADTKGYEADIGRYIWKYRDWVIKSFNENKPYDRFIIEQIAGDLLPNPTDANYIATGFHRNSMTNDEGGTDNEEFRTAAVLDRVNTTWESLMGTTFSCVQCHSHPYDPFRHDEYYKFMAYFNNTRDADTNSDYPLLRDFDDAGNKKFGALKKWLEAHASKEEQEKFDLLIRTLQPARYAAYVDSVHDAVVANNNGDLLFKTRAYACHKKVNLEKAAFVAYRYLTFSNTGTLEIRLDSANGPVIAATNLAKRNDWSNIMQDIPMQRGVHDVYLVYRNSVPPEKKDDIRLYFDWLIFPPELPGAGIAGYSEALRNFRELMTMEAKGTPVMVENDVATMRKSNVFERGNWRTKGKQVTPAVPATFAFAMPDKAPNNRMGLAMWLVDKRNPLVSRTMVNRLWEQLFGTGIVETLEDMGTQGIAPTHRELLDHLSCQFMNEYNWDVKKLIREMVLSYTYRQASQITDEAREKDPYNKFYARGPRVRLSAEQIRDQDLVVSGMMSNKMYGPGVMPWQPDGIWLSPYNGARWQTDSAENHYRRAVYTYWKRTSPYPSMIAFDGAQRNVCSARRIRTNTPLQALVTLNDSVYVDLARHFAKRMKAEGGNSVESQIAKGYEIMMYKEIRPEKLKLFTDLYHKAGKSDSALTIVANAMLNLDEMITKN